MNNTLPPYKGNEQYYRELIGKINRELDFPGYLLSLNYELIKKSVGSFEFEKGNDRIVLMRKRDPITYWNRNDHNDNGLIFKFIKRRAHSFFEAVKTGLEACNNSHLLKSNEEIKIEKKQNKLQKSLEESYNIYPLTKSVYLTYTCQIDKKTLENEMFKGRILNAFHIRDDGGKIPNIAFPRYNGSNLNEVKSYLLYNRDYTNKETGKKEKFRLYLNENYHYLWTSNPEIKTDEIFIAEAAPDALAHSELKRTKNSFYIALGGTVSNDKLKELLTIIKLRSVNNPNTKIISITDNDESGYIFDFKIVNALINEYNKDITITTEQKVNKVKFQIEYKNNTFPKAEEDINLLKVAVKNLNEQLRFTENKAQLFLLKDKLVLEFPLYEMQSSLHSKTNKIINTRYSVTGLKYLLWMYTKAYNPRRFEIQKSVSKDWKQDLINKKKVKTKDQQISL